MTGYFGEDGVTFSDLWESYPLPDDELKDLCFLTWRDQWPRTKVHFSNYCSIRMSECLIRAGLRFKVEGRRCYSHRKDVNHLNRHFLLAEQMAAWLDRRPFRGMPQTLKLRTVGVAGKDPHDYAQILAGKTGIVFFKDYWLRNGETEPTGDHIDVWDGQGTKTSRGYDCKEVWFWEIN